MELIFERDSDGVVTSNPKNLEGAYPGLSVVTDEQRIALSDMVKSHEAQVNELSKAMMDQVCSLLKSGGDMALIGQVLLDTDIKEEEIFTQMSRTLLSALSEDIENDVMTIDSKVRRNTTSSTTDHVKMLSAAPEFFRMVFEKK